MQNAQITLMQKQNLTALKNSQILIRRNTLTPPRRKPEFLNLEKYPILAPKSMRKLHKIRYF